MRCARSVSVGVMQPKRRCRRCDHVVERRQLVLGWGGVGCSAAERSCGVGWRVVTCRGGVEEMALVPLGTLSTAHGRRAAASTAASTRARLQ